jgi:multicomponent Na+:H+ antiporter subunit B
VTPRRRLRAVAAVPAVGVLSAVMAWGFSGLPAFGHFHGFYGQLLAHIAVPQRHATNVVTAVVFDYRGFDTLGEELILFAAVIGVVMLLREDDEAQTGRPDARDDVHSDALRVFGTIVVAAGVLVGLWLAAFGLVTPGGGFQGGVAIAAAVAVLYLAAGYRPWLRVADKKVLDAFDGFGAGGYVAVGLAALIAGAPFLHNLFAPGKAGTLWSGGSMNLLNWMVAIEVAAANLVLYTEFLESYLVPHLSER